MSDKEQQFLDARQAFRTNLRGHNQTVIDAFKELALANEQQSAHRADTNNPHGLTKASVGLDLVENRAPATAQDVIDLTNLDRLVTPATLAQLIQDPRMIAGAVINAVRTPRPLSPTGGEVVGGTTDLVLTADEYRHMYSREIEGQVQRIPRQHREFEVYEVDGASTPIWTGQSTEDTITVDATLVRTTSYRWRCRDVSIDGEEGLWSPLSRFTTPGSQVVTPTLSFEGGINSVVKYPRVTTSAFATEGASDIHTRTTWRLFNINAAQPVWELDSTSDLIETRLPGQYLYPATTYQLEVIHHSQGAGQATTGRVTFVTMERFPFTPGPVNLYWGDETTGYYGDVPQSEFISGEQLFLETGLSEGQATPWANTTSWIKIHLDGQVAYLPRYPLRYGVTKEGLNALGLMGDGKEITLNQTVYRVRSLYGLVPDWSTDPNWTRLGQFPENDPVLTADSEWNRVMSMVLTWLQVGSDQTEIGLTDSYRHNVVAELSPESEVIVRGGGQFPVADSRALSYVDAFNSVEYDTTPQWVSWRPVLIVKTEGITEEPGAGDNSGVVELYASPTYQNITAEDTVYTVVNKLWDGKAVVDNLVNKVSPVDGEWSTIPVVLTEQAGPDTYNTTTVSPVGGQAMLKSAQSLSFEISSVLSSIVLDRYGVDNEFSGAFVVPKASMGTFDANNGIVPTVSVSRGGSVYKTSTSMFMLSVLFEDDDHYYFGLTHRFSDNNQGPYGGIDWHWQVGDVVTISGVEAMTGNPLPETTEVYLYGIGYYERPPA